MKKTILCIAIWLISLPTLFSKQYESIRNLDGVIGIAYESPYIFVIIESYDDRLRIQESVNDIIESKSEPDIESLEAPIHLKVCDTTTFNAMIQDLRLYKSIETIKDLETYIERSYFTSLYILDWKSDTIVADRLIRKRFKNELLPDMLEHEEKKLKQIISQLKEKELKPEKLLVVVYVSIGIATFPVYDNTVIINGEEFDFSKLRIKFKKTK